MSENIELDNAELDAVAGGSLADDIYTRAAELRAKYDAGAGTSTGTSTRAGQLLDDVRNQISGS